MKTGQDTADSRTVRDRRETASYKMFKEWHEFLSTNPPPDKVLGRLFDFLDSKFFFKSRKNTDSALKSLNLLLADAGRPEKHTRRYDRSVFIIDMKQGAPGSLWPPDSTEQEILEHASYLEHALQAKFPGLQIAKTYGQDTTEYGPYPVQGPDAKEIGQWVMPRIESILEKRPISLRHYFRVTLVGSGDTQERAWLDAVEAFGEDPGPAEVMGDDYTTTCEDEDPDIYYEERLPAMAAGMEM